MPSSSMRLTREASENRGGGSVSAGDSQFLALERFAFAHGGQAARSSRRRRVRPSCRTAPENRRTSPPGRWRAIQQARAGLGGDVDGGAFVRNGFPSGLATVRIQISRRARAFGSLEPGARRPGGPARHVGWPDRSGLPCAFSWPLV